MRTAPLLLAALVLAPLVPLAEASNHCGSSIVFVSGTPSTTVPGTSHLVATFADAPSHCNVADWNFNFSRNGIPFSSWNKLGSWSLQGDNYVIEADAILDEATWTVTVDVTEVCCGTGGTAATGVGSWTILVTNSPPPTAACSDSIDNDGDARTDYPNDPGCSSASDATETVDCPETAPDVQVCTATGRHLVDLEVYDPEEGQEHTIAGYLDRYRFGGNGLPSAIVPCVTLVVDGQETNPCATAGGQFVERQQTLVSDSVHEPALGDDPIATISVCEAEVAVLVAGFGIESAPAYLPC